MKVRPLSLKRLITPMICETLPARLQDSLISIQATSLQVSRAPEKSQEIYWQLQKHGTIPRSGFVRPQFSWYPPIRVRVTRFDCQGKRVVRVFVPRGGAPVYCADKVPYIRDMTSVSRAGPEDLPLIFSLFLHFELFSPCCSLVAGTVESECCVLTLERDRRTSRRRSLRHP